MGLPADAVPAVAPQFRRRRAGFRPVGPRVRGRWRRQAWSGRQTCVAPLLSRVLVGPALGLLRRAAVSPFLLAQHSMANGLIRCCAATPTASVAARLWPCRPTGTSMERVVAQAASAGPALEPFPPRQGTSRQARLQALQLPLPACPPALGERVFPCSARYAGRQRRRLPLLQQTGSEADLSQPVCSAKKFSISALRPTIRRQTNPASCPA